VPAGDEHEADPLRLAGPVDRRHRRVLDREELAAALVDVVRQAAAKALAGQRELALYPVAIGLEEDALAGAGGSRGS
jgi:hypothetical protein